MLSPRPRLLWLALCLFIAGCQAEEQKTEVTREVPPLPVETVTIERMQLPIWLEYTGKTEATSRVEVKARVAGRLQEALFTEGDYVSQGAVLFRIEPDKYQADLDQAKARLERNRATLALARKDVERYAPLVADGLAPRVTLEQYQARVAELEASLKADQATIREAELNLGYTEVEAPISGRVGRNLIDVGNLVGYGQQTTLTTIISDDPIYAYFNPTEVQFQLMRRYKSEDQMTAMVRIPNSLPGLLERSALSGRVDFTDNRVDRMTGTITMRAEVANPDHTLLEGTFVYVEVMVTDTMEFLMLPPEAIQEDQRSSFVYIVAEGDTAKRADIVRGYENRHYVMVEDGLAGGERVVVSGLTRIVPGARLAPVDKTGERGVAARLEKQSMLPGKE